MTTKKEFLSEHNKLSPANLKATMSMLLRFKIDKPALVTGDDWSIDKLRRPFLLWLTSLTRAKKEDLEL